MFKKKKKGKSDHITLMLKTLQWLPVSCRVQPKALRYLRPYPIWLPVTSLTPSLTTVPCSLSFSSLASLLFLGHVRQAGVTPTLELLHLPKYLSPRGPASWLNSFISSLHSNVTFSERLTLIILLYTATQLPSIHTPDLLSWSNFVLFFHNTYHLPI